MKKKIGLLLVSLGLIALSACGSQTDIVGTWSGDSTLDVLGEDLPFEYAETIEFTKNGLMIVESSSSRVELSYSLTDDTLTFTNDGISMGIGYHIEGNTLTIETGGDSAAVFTRAE